MKHHITQCVRTVPSRTYLDGDLSAVEGLCHGGHDLHYFLGLVEQTGATASRGGGGLRDRREIEKGNDESKERNDGIVKEESEESEAEIGRYNNRGSGA